MFGLGKSKDHVPELLEYMIEKMGFRAKYAGAFLSMYSRQVSKLFDDGVKRIEKSGVLSDPMVRLGSLSLPDPREMALVGQAYNAYMSDLKGGIDVGHVVEVAILVLLCDNLEFVKTVNPGLSSYLKDKQPQLYPNIFKEAYEF